MNTSLITKSLLVGERAIEISEATYMMGIRRGNIIGEYIDNEAYGEIERNVLTGIYAPLAACSSGDVPGADEFLAMRETEVEKWLTVAKELNPSWFAWLDVAAQKLGEAIDQTIADAEKKKKRGSSTSN